MKVMMQTTPVSMIFADDDDFTSMFVEDFIPILPACPPPTMNGPGIHPSGLNSLGRGINTRSVQYNSGQSAATNQNVEVIDLLDDD